MKKQSPLLVFTDLDGTLLCHSTYQWDAARPALERLADIGAGVVLASSKTAAEIGELRKSMGLEAWPAIVENGAGSLKPYAEVTTDCSIYAQLRSRLNKISPQLRNKFVGFADLDAREVSDITGLTLAAAELAQQRSFSEPGTWHGSAQEQAKFLAQLAELGISARSGGRFLTLSFGSTKADQMAHIIADHAPRHTIALGDAPNDVEMLEAADFGIIIANPNKSPLPLLKGEETGRITRSQYAGPEGWNAMMQEHLARLNL